MHGEGFGIVMKISILTIAPEEFDGFLSSHVVKRAVDVGALHIEIVDVRDFADGSFRHVDEKPYGGGGGMILRCEPVLRCLEAVRKGTEGEALSVALTPRGEVFTQNVAKELAGVEHLILVCGHFEGMDERIYHHMDREISIGDYIMTGGELPAQVIVNAVIRLLPGVLRAGRAEEESFENGLLEYPQYTKPAEYNGEKVPDVLLSGDHEAVRRWREEAARELTRDRRPGLLRKR